MRRRDIAIAVAAACAVICGCQPPDIDDVDPARSEHAIVNGKASSLEAAVKITSTDPQGGAHLCSGVVVDGKAVLTAAHCVAELKCAPNGTPACNYTCGNCPYCSAGGCPLIATIPYSNVRVEVNGAQLAPAGDPAGAGGDRPTARLAPYDQTPVGGERRGGQLAATRRARGGNAGVGTGVGIWR